MVYPCMVALLTQETANQAESQQIKSNYIALWFRKSDSHQQIYESVFRWLSQLITRLLRLVIGFFNQWEARLKPNAPCRIERLLPLLIGLKDSRQFFNQWEAKPKPIAPCTRYLSRASSELHVIARNCDWFIALPAPVVIGRSNCFGFGFSTVIWKPL